MADAPIHRVGIGTDIHRFVEGGPLKLGGIEIPYGRHLYGHSDADVVLHALTDALLGAAGLPDIGELFPDTDPKYKGADSRVLLMAALEMVEAEGFRPVNIDIIVHAERPKLSAVKMQMRAAIANLIAIDTSRVNIKAKTNEELDSIGRGESIACTCVVGLSKKT